MNTRRLAKLSLLAAVTALPLLSGIGCTAQDGSSVAEPGKDNVGVNGAALINDPLGIDPIDPMLDPTNDPGEPPPPPPALTTQTLEIGDGWRKIRVFGTANDSETGIAKPVDRILVVVQDKTKISTAPVATFVKTAVEAEVASATTATTDTTFLAKTVDGTALAAPAPVEEDGGALIIDQAAAEQVQAQANSGVTFFSVCPDYDKTFQKTLSTNKTYSRSDSFTSGDFTGSFNASANLVASVTGKVVVRVKRSYCIPYGVDFKYAQVTGTANVKATGKVDGKFEKAWKYDKKLAQPSLGELPFAIGPIPLDIRFSAPIHVGLEASAKATVKLDGVATGNGTFDVKCTKSGCTGSKSATYGWGGGTAPTVALEGRVDVTPYAYAGVHANVYTDWIGYGEVGVKAKIKGELWGYYGNTCGDANEDGVPEFVSGAALEVRGGVDLVGKAGFIGSNYGPWTYPLLDKHIVYYDLMPGGSSAASALVTLTKTGGTGVEAKVKMRPCWPWNDAMKYRLNWNDGSALEDTAATHPDLLVTKAHSYATYGSKTVTATPFADVKGRGPGKADSDSVYLSPFQFTPIPIEGVLMK